MTNAAITIRKHLTNISEWRKLGEANIFPPDCRLELIQGEIFEMSPIGPNHASHVKRLNKLFTVLVGDSAIIAVQDPLLLGEFSEPEPDLMLVHPVPDFYENQHPTAADVWLLIEVADSSIEFDRNQKLALYAAHNIPEYWLLNLNDSCLEVYRQPQAETYREKTTLGESDTVSLLRLPNIKIDLVDIL